MAYITYKNTIKIMKDGVGCIRTYTDNHHSPAAAEFIANKALPNDQTLWVVVESETIREEQNYPE